MDCIFCKISQGALPANKVYEDDDILAFNDIQPQAPVHVLIIPKRHIASADDINASNSAVVAAIFEKLSHIAELAGAADGYRVITNCGNDGRQTVGHLHFHLLGGKQLPVTIV